MPRDSFVSFRTLALFVLVPPLAVVALLLLPLTLLVLAVLYSRGAHEARLESATERSRGPTEN
ncbi:hypothetical protein JCM30237_10070 [Halolamina litorea]|jgi:hypothetical protein|uniref:Uncharacterized protein n=1 Tax=Halolamina litorea TaxID=1515593 RepID=A0ABD6BUL3_9EURY|nr:hypothetical protein [Halolamina litorea]